MYKTCITKAICWQKKVIRVLEDLLGNNAFTKVLDFFLENRFWDYTKKDVANESGISRTQLYRFWNVLEKFELVKETRKIGGTTLYKVNLDSPIIRLLEQLSQSVADEINERILIEEKKAISPMQLMK